MALRPLGAQQVEVGIYLHEETHTAVVDGSSDPNIPVGSVAVGSTALEALEMLARKLRQKSETGG